MSQVFREVFYGTIVDVVSHVRTRGKLVKEISFAMEKVANPETNEITIVKRSSFVREVYDNDNKPLSEIDLLALRGRRVQVQIYADYWIIVPMD